MIQLKAATVVNIFHLLAVVESQAVGESQETDYRLLYIQNILLFTTFLLDGGFSTFSKFPSLKLMGKSICNKICHFQGMFLIQAFFFIKWW